jgi:hypothetical protein
VNKKDLFDLVIEIDDLRKDLKEQLLALFAPPLAVTMGTAAICNSPRRI